jgi:hypothetical protein
VSWPDDGRPRYVVAITRGYRTTRTGSAKTPPGLEAMVLDRADAHRVVASFASEEERHGNTSQRRDRATERAYARCAELNAAVTR